MLFSENAANDNYVYIILDGEVKLTKKPDLHDLTKKNLDKDPPKVIQHNYGHSHHHKPDRSVHVKDIH